MRFRTESLSDEAFIFLNDPFSDEVFTPFIEKVLAHQASINREVFIVYKNNNRREMNSLVNLKSKFEYMSIDISGNYFEIYRIF